MPPTTQNSTSTPGGSVDNNLAESGTGGLATAMAIAPHIPRAAHNGTG